MFCQELTVREQLIFIQCKNDHGLLFKFGHLFYEVLTIINSFLIQVSCHQWKEVIAFRDNQKIGIGIFTSKRFKSMSKIGVIGFFIRSYLVFCRRQGNFCMEINAMNYLNK